MQEMKPRQLKDYLQASAAKPLLLDVREPWEYNICHIKGSQLIPMQSISAHLHKLDRQQETIVICHHGVRSKMVARFLEQAQFEQIINLSGGVNLWAQEVDLSMLRY